MKNRALKDKKPEIFRAGILKKSNIQKEIVETITNRLDFFAVIITNNFYGSIRSLVIKKKDYMAKLEALFWYKSVSLLFRNLSATASLFSQNDHNGNQYLN